MKQIYMKIISTLLFVLVILVAGCAGKTYHYYSGNHLPETSLASIKPWKVTIFSSSGQSLDVYPILIDGKTTETYRISLPSYLILPGEHTIQIALLGTLKGINGLIKIKDPKTMTFQAKAGHTYITKAFISKKSQVDAEIKINTSFWVEDENTGEVVSGTRLTE